MFRTLIKEPLFHFLLLGAAIFLLSRAMSNPSATADQIVISAGSVDQMMEGFTRTWNRPPTEQQLQGLINDYIKEEVFYREAVALGLDREDTIVRRRMHQKLEFLSEDLTRIPEPTEKDLQNFLKLHMDQFRIGTKVSFSHIYFSPDRRGDFAERDANAFNVKLARFNGSVDLSQTGDPFLLSPDHAALPDTEVAKLFGSEFAAELQKVEPNKWTGPLKSEYGFHLVFVRAKEDGRLPPLSEIRDKVHREWTDAQRRQAKENFFKKLRDKYVVSVELPKHLNGVVRVKSVP
jgi:PPIC-type PPIASE domain